MCRYRERVQWATEGSPPNILSVVASVARGAAPSLPSSHGAEHPPQTSTVAVAFPPRPPPAGTPATLRRPRDHSKEALEEPAKRPSPSQMLCASTVTPSPIRTPPHPCAQPLTSQALAAAKVINDAAGKLPAFVMPDVCFKCACNTHSAEQCSAPRAANISHILFNANCCARCALPLKRAGNINCHPGAPAGGCNGSLFFMSKLLREPLATITSVFQPQNFGLQLELLASFLPKQ